MSFAWERGRLARSQGGPEARAPREMPPHFWSKPGVDTRLDEPPSPTTGSGTRLAWLLLTLREGGALSCAPSADAVAGKGRPLNWVSG